MNGNYIQLVAVGAMDQILNENHPTTHVSQNIKKIELNQFFNLNDIGDLIENVFLSFPEKYNKFCMVETNNNNNNNLLNYIDSVTITINTITINTINETITNEAFKIIYYLPSGCLPVNEKYNALKYTSIDDNSSIFIPNFFKQLENTNTFVGSFFQEQKVIICPLWIKTKNLQIKVSIQRYEENLLVNKDVDNSINNSINILASDPIYSNPVPITYVGSTLFNINTVIPNHIPKNQSLDDVFLEFIQEERKLWSNYNELKSTETKDWGNFEYAFNSNKCRYPNGHCSHLFFVREIDLDNIESIIMTINGNIVCNIDSLWLQTRYEEYKLNISKDKKVFIDNNILLPIPPIYSKNIISNHLLFIIKTKNPLMNPPILLSKSKKDLDYQFCDNNDNNISAIIQINNNCIDYNPLHSELNINFNFLLCQSWSVLTYKNNICSSSSPHPFFKLQFIFNDDVFMEGSGDYYHKVVPLFFEQPIAEKHLIYRMMFQNTPLSFSYPVAKNPYKPSQFISNYNYYSTLNVSKIDKIKIKVFWDEEVIKQHYPETDQLKLYFFSETFNFLKSLNGTSVLQFAT